MPDRHGEAGFTLIELLVSMTLGIVLLLATLLALDTATSTSARNARVTDASDLMRTQLDRMTREIRNAQVSPTSQNPILRADANDVVVRNISSSGTQLVRYCLDASSNTLYRQTAPDGTSLPTACPAAATWTSAPIAAGRVLNSAATPVFTPNSQTLTAVRSVGIALQLQTSGPGRSTRLTTAATLRSYSGRPLGLDPGAIRVTCQPDGTALVDLTAGTDPDGSPLTATASSTGDVTIGRFSASQTMAVGASAQGTLKVVVKNALGLQQLLFRPVSCP